MKPLYNGFMPEPPVQDLYFGCEGQIGHNCFWPGMRSAGREVDKHFRNWAALDGSFLPKTDIQGCAALHHISFSMRDGWVGYTVLSFPDNSIDHRSGSHSTFVLHKSPITFHEAIGEAKALFPEVFGRFRFNITLVDERRIKQLINAKTGALLAVGIEHQEFK